MNVAEALNAKGATAETILQIMSATVFESSGDLSSTDMNAVLANAVGGACMEQAKGSIQAHPEVVEEIALLWLAALAEDENQAESLYGAMAAADRQMPLLETALLGLLALYGLYLMGPDKPTTIEETIKRNPDGTFERTKKTQYADFSSPLRGLLAIFKGSEDSNNG